MLDYFDVKLGKCNQYLLYGHSINKDRLENEIFKEKEQAKLLITSTEISSDLTQETKQPTMLKHSLGHIELECSKNLDVIS